MYKIEEPQPLAHPHLLGVAAVEPRKDSQQDGKEIGQMYKAGEIVIRII